VPANAAAAAAAMPKGSAAAPLKPCASVVFP
jgi:hypothetical protein